MNSVERTKLNRQLRRQRVRAKIKGTQTQPRLSVHVSGRHISAQLIDDDKQRTLAYVTTVGQKAAKGNMVERSEWVGSEIAAKAKDAKVKHVVFDRGSKLYHGRVKALAEAAREKGLEF